MFGFTEPYLFDKPIQAGFTVFTRRFSFDQGREASIFAGQNLIPLYEALGAGQLPRLPPDQRRVHDLCQHPAAALASRGVGVTYSYQTGQDPDRSAVRRRTCSTT